MSLRLLLKRNDETFVVLVTDDGKDQVTTLHRTEHEAEDCVRMNFDLEDDMKFNEACIDAAVIVSMHTFRYRDLP